MHEYLYVGIYKCICIRIYIHTYIHTHIHTHTHTDAAPAPGVYIYNIIYIYIYSTPCFLRKCKSGRTSGAQQRESDKGTVDGFRVEGLGLGFGVISAERRR